MIKNARHTLTYDSQVIFETVVDGQQGIAIIEKGHYHFTEGKLRQLITHNETYYATNLAVAKRLAHDILGSAHAAPYFFSELVWVPLEVHNRSVMIYVALHQIGRIRSVTKDTTMLELHHGIKVLLNMSVHSVYKRLLVSCVLKTLLDVRKKFLYEAVSQGNPGFEIVKEQGNVFYTKKRDEQEEE